MAFFSTKTYGGERGLSCAMRAWTAESHCNLLHGYSLGFRFTFAAEQLDHRGWVVDFGKGGFGPIREWLHATFDHTTLVARDDPHFDAFVRLRDLGLCDMRVLPAVSCERIAQFVFDHTQPMIEQATGGRCWVVSVECFEHGANSAIYQNPETVLRQVSAEALAAIVAREGGS